MLLSWVGGFREEPFTVEEHARFDALVAPMQRALALRRALLDSGLARNGLIAALEAVGAPAFIARRDGTVLFASESGAALFESVGRSFPNRLRAAIEGVRASLDFTSSVTRLSGAGAPERYLIVLRDHESTLRLRLADARRRWKVSRRETEVLRLVVRGESNKEIALKLGIHEGSVERHVTSLLRKMRADSRSRLIALFWTMH